MKKVFLLATIAIAFMTLSCDDDDNTPSLSEITLNLLGLEDLGADYVYEGWLIVNGNPVSTGTFSSITFPQTFEVNRDDLSMATTFVLSVEPAIDPDPAPAATKIFSW